MGNSEGGKTMGKASTRAQNRYIAKAYDRINLTVPKGRKGVIQAHAEVCKESVNGFINRAISESIRRDNLSADSRQASPQVPETPQDGALVLMQPGQMSVGRGNMRTIYTASDTGREYYVEPVISDEEWEMLQRAKDASVDDPDKLPF